MRGYTVLLDPWEGGGGYTVTVPALPGCVTQGKSKEEALERAKEAIACHVQGLRADGEEEPLILQYYLTVKPRVSVPRPPVI